MYVLVYVDHYSDVYTSRLGGENFYCDYIDHSMSNRQNAHSARANLTIIYTDH